MIKVVSWNINKQNDPWSVLKSMGQKREADVALLQETGRPPTAKEWPLQEGEKEYWDAIPFEGLPDRRCRVVALNKHVTVEHFRQVPPGIFVGKSEIGVSGMGTIAVARVIPKLAPEDAFVAVSMYAQWIKLNPVAGKGWNISDASAHRILSDLSMFIATADPPEASQHRILAAGDLNMFYGSTGTTLSMPERERTVWKRFKRLGFEFLGPQLPNGRWAKTQPPDVPADTQNVPTAYDRATESPESARRQLDYAFAFRGFHKKVRVRALNGVDEWGPSDHCRLLIEVNCGR